MTTVYEALAPRQKAGEVGIEIEVEGSGLISEVNNYWNVVADNSLRGESAEYVLRNPVKRKEVTKVLKALVQDWERAGTKVNNKSPRTSVHVHVNVQELTYQQVINYICLYSIFEEILVKWCGETREGNLFCLRQIDADYLIDALVELARKGSWNGFGDSNLRYASINVCALPKYGSLEFRAMRGTDNIEVIRNWINILLRIKDHSLEYKRGSDIIESLSASGDVKFLERVLGEYSELVSCKGMNEMIRQGVRRIQELAYVIIPDKKPPVKKKGRGIEAGQIFQDEIVYMTEDGPRIVPDRDVGTRPINNPFEVTTMVVRNDTNRVTVVDDPLTAPDDSTQLVPTPIRPPMPVYAIANALNYPTWEEYVKEANDRYNSFIIEGRRIGYNDRELHNMMERGVLDLRRV